MKRIYAIYLLCQFQLLAVFNVQAQLAKNPIMYTDVPDLSMIRVGNTYYMSSTTMHMSPGVPIMKSTDLVNWEMVSYCYDRLDETDDLNLNNGKSTYGKGSWASSIRYHNGTYYVSTFAQTTGKTYIFTTNDIEKGPWKKISFGPALHDHSLFFDDDGKIYMVYGAGKIRTVELKPDLSGIVPGSDKIIIENASLPSTPEGTRGGLPAEGSQLFKINGKYYLLNITWPPGGMRTVIVHRADKIGGPYEGRVALKDMGVAQGGLINTPSGDWYAYLFRDYGAVGRIPYWVPVQWENGWPVFGVGGKVPETLNLPVSRGITPGIVATDEFKRKKNEPDLPLVWQWNHNPDKNLWSVTDRKGFLRLTTGAVDTSVLLVKNILTQRSFGPECSAVTTIDISNMKDGDKAGIILLQQQYGWVGVKAEGITRSIVMVNGEKTKPVEIESIPLTQKIIYLKAYADYRDRKDRGYFYYSLDGKNWISIGNELKMAYTIPHFMGYRFGLFNYATKLTGGFVDFDYYRIGDRK